VILFLSETPVHCKPACPMLQFRFKPGGAHG